MPERASPEEFLKRAQVEEEQARRGKLKIYLGAAPGVGKTYTMLQDAISQREQGLNVIVGVVESHGRQEIKKLLQNFETLPRQEVSYRDKKFMEFDLDAALKRNPGLILIDEMAHTNVPGVRHKKRWQDIKEILDRGIDVYTTLNVQHLESINDDISQIIGIKVKETVPDSMLELADTIELIDLPAQDLLKRLREGKVYFPKHIELAAENFFQKDKLTALRELALRITAERVGAQILLYRMGEGAKPIWPSREKILVCVGRGSESLKLIRTAKRMASVLHTDWLAVHVEVPKLHLTQDERNAAIKNLYVAEQLGAETRVLTGFDMVKEIMNFAREQNVTQIVIGKKIQPRWRNLFFRSLADEVVRYSGEIDVYVITGGIEPTLSKKIKPKRFITWKIYFFALGIVTLATLLNFFLFPFLSASSLIMVYLLGIVLVALFGQVGPSIFASILSVIAYDFFFIPPFYSFAVSDIEYIFTMIVMLIIAQIISNLTILVRRQANSSYFIEHQTAILHTLSRKLASTRGIDKILDISAHFLGDMFHSQIVILIPENNRLAIRGRYGLKVLLDNKELSIAQWVYELGQKAGFGTDTLSFSKGRYFPLVASKETVGVLRIEPLKQHALFTPEEMQLLESCAHQIALALEVDRLQEQDRKSELYIELDRVKTRLLQDMSRNLRTPIVAAMGSANTLSEKLKELDTNEIKKLGQSIYSELVQANQLINNLLQISYLESASIQLEKKMSSLQELVSLILASLGAKLSNRKVHLEIPATLPQIPMNSSLIQDVLIQLIDNAIKFSPDESIIKISAKLENNQIIISISDQGPGIMSDEKDKLFEKYYRGREIISERGLGLGLAICQKIIVAHGGKIWVENPPEGGADFRIALPRF